MFSWSRGLVFPGPIFGKGSDGYTVVINADTFTVSTEDNVSCTRKTFSSESELLEILINWKNEMYSDEGKKRLRRFQQIAPMLYWERCYPSFVGRWHGRPVVHITEKYLRAFLEENEGDQIDHHFTGEGGHERLFNVLEGWIGRNFMTQEQEQAQKQEQIHPSQKNIVVSSLLAIVWSQQKSMDCLSLSQNPLVLHGYGVSSTKKFYCKVQRSTALRMMLFLTRERDSRSTKKMKS